MVNSIAVSLKDLNALTVQRLSKTSLPGNAVNSALASSCLLELLLVTELVCCACSCLIDLRVHNLRATTEHHSSNPLSNVILFLYLSD